MKRLMTSFGLVLALGAPATAQEPKGMPVARLQQIMREVAQQCPRQWQMAHTHAEPGNPNSAWHPEARDFMIHVVRRVYPESGGTVGGNWRRGDVGDLSMDGVSFVAHDGQYYYSDTIVGAGGPNPAIGWGGPGLLRDRSGTYIARRGFVAPGELPRPVVECTRAGSGTTSPAPPPPAPTAGVELRAILDAIAKLRSLAGR